MAAVISILAFSIAIAGPAHADPGCQNGGVYILWARGSNQPIGSDEGQQFQRHIQDALRAAGMGPYAWAELGNLDGNGIVDPGTEYPASAVPWSVITGQYTNSVTIGANELVANLNRRYASEPSGYGCASEIVILGGFSQGADVIGTALARNGSDGYAALSTGARNHIGFVALYGDPKLDGWNCPKAIWARANSVCNSAGILGRRQPYVSEELLYRLGSWCDQGDGICDARANSAVGNHTSIYRDWWIWQSAAEVVHVAQTRHCQLNICPTNQMLIAPDASVYAKNTLGMGGWSQEAGPGNANKISAGGANQLFIRGDAAVLGRSGVGTNWMQETSPGNANAIAVSSSGTQMFIRGDAAIFAKQGTGAWVQEVSPGNAAAIAAGGNTQMFIRGDAAIFAREGVGEGGWVQQVGPGNATKIAVSSTGIQMFIRGDGAIFAKRSLTDGWSQEVGAGNAIAIAIGGETQVFLRHDGTVFAKTWVGDGGWIPQTSSGTAKAIAACGDGSIMMLRADNATFIKRGVAPGWIQETAPASATAISCG